MGRKFNEGDHKTNRTTQKRPGLDCPHPNKTAYAHRKDAKRALRIVKQRLGSDGKAGRPQVYKCECGAFHIGRSVYFHRKPEEKAAPHVDDVARRRTARGQFEVPPQKT